MGVVQFIFDRHIFPPFTKEIFGKSLCLSLFWYYILQMLFYNVLNHFDINLFQWILNYWHSLIMIQFYAKAVLLLFASLLMITEGRLKYFYYNKRHYSCRFLHIKNYFLIGPFYVLFCLLHGIIIGSIYMINTDIRNTDAVNYFFQIVGIWTMLCLYIPNSTFGMSPTIFPSLELRKLFPNIFDVCRLLSRSLIQSLQINLKLLFVFSSIWFVTHNFSFMQYPLGIYLVFHSWLLTVFMILSKQMLDWVIDFLLMRPINFNINVDVRHDSSHDPFALLTAITSNAPALRYLGYYDLLRISKDKDRIRELFSLTRPGCYPLTWNRICDQIISFVNIVTEDLKIIINEKHPVDNRQIIFNNACTPITSKRINNARNVTEYFAYEKQSSDWQQIYLHNMLPSIPSRSNNLLFQFRFTSYFFEDLPEMNLNDTIEKNSQSLSLACESLSNIAHASITEDLYGIVQERLPEIIHALLQLHSQLKRLDVLMIHIRRYPQTLLLKHSLTYLVNSSIHLLAIVFGPYVKGLHLSLEDERCFRDFI